MERKKKQELNDKFSVNPSGDLPNRKRICIVCVNLTVLQISNNILFYLKEKS